MRCVGGAVPDSGPLEATQTAASRLIGPPGHTEIQYTVFASSTVDEGACPNGPACRVCHFLCHLRCLNQTLGGSGQTVSPNSFEPV